jgi:formamidopyrimidine-DNA glycosylase
MPEIAEVKIFTDQLNKEFGGQALQNVEIVGGRFLKKPIEKFHQLIFPLSNTRFHCKGKFLYWTFDDEEEVFFITLGMAASFGPKSKHSAIKFSFDEGDIYFNDIRHFGTFKISDHAGLHAKLNTLGWDPLQNPIMPPDLPTKLRDKCEQKCIAEALLDQRIFAGVGNYIRSEALYMSNIHPLHPVEGGYGLSNLEIKKLCEQIVLVVQEAYKSGGATIVTFKDMYGNTGKFFDKFKVYSRRTDPENRPIIKFKAPDGRSVFFVKEAQKLPFIFRGFIKNEYKAI